MKNTKLEKYPVEIQEKVRNVLGAFPRCHVTRANGIYSVSTSIMLVTDYATDHKIETFEANEVLTKSEQDLAYINEFYEFPITYKGERDWKQLKEAKEKRLTYVYDNKGNFVIK